MVRGRLGWWLLVALLATGCTTSNANQSQASDHTDVWFMQHMVPHLLQTTATVELAGDRITRPKLARLAVTIGRQGQAVLGQLQGWLADRGLPSYDPQQDPDHGRETDLLRLSRAHGASFDLVFVKVMTVRHRKALHMARVEARDGSVPEVRALARQMVAALEAQLRQLAAWRQAWAKTGT